MSIESIELLARSFDNELKQLEKLSNSSPNHMSPHHRLRMEGGSARPDALPEHSFELAAAESERERLHDKLNDLSERVEELELHNRHQDGIITQLRKRNKDLESKLQCAGDDNLNQSSVQGDAVEETNEMYRLKYKALELELQEAKLLLEQSQKSLQDVNLSRQNVALEHQEEVAKRMHAEKQRDAYAAAYRQALKHIEKWSV